MLTRCVQNQSRITRMRRICSFTYLMFVVGFSAPVGRYDWRGFFAQWEYPPLDKIRWIRIIRVRFTTEFFTNADISDWRGCFAREEVLSSRQLFYMSWKSRDFVPGYSRYARYWLPARSPLLVCSLTQISPAVGNPAPYRRKYNPKEIQDQVESEGNEIREKDKIRRIGVIREPFWAHADWAVRRRSRKETFFFYFSLLILL